MNILLVDNTPLYRNILEQSLLDLHDFELTFAGSVAEAKALCSKQHFYFYVIAWQLPDGEGIDLARSLRDGGVLEPLVLLTSSPSHEMSLKAANAGVTELFRKQDIEELVTFMRRFLGIFAAMPCRLLYVEDTRDQREVLSAQLRAWGMQVDAFASADEAWLALQDTHYDLLICDIVLSGRMSGSRLINRIRRLSGAKGSLPILAASAFDNPARRTELFYLGVDDYIAKPIVFMELRARIQTLLARKKAVDRNALLLKATALGIIVVNEAGQVLSFDNNAQETFICSEKEVLGSNVNTLLSAEGLLKQCDLRSRCLAHSCGRADFSVEVSVVELEALSGQRSFALLVRDLSEEVELEKTLLQAKEAAEKTSRTKSEFLANMSHEIRTPLNGVLGMAQLGLRSSANPAKADGMFRKIISSGKLLQGIIDDILDFSKMEAGKLKIENQPLDLPDVLEHVIDLIREPAMRKGLHLQLLMGENLPRRCIADPLRLRQVLMNLMSNAVKFTEQGEVFLRAERVDNQLVFSVTDSGIGIDPAHLARLFRPFEQADGSITRKYGGTGLGLVISKRLIDMMQGTIKVESALGQGSCFEVFLPLLEADAGSGNVLEVQPAANKSGQRLRGISILIAEDNEINQLILEENLLAEGAHLVIVADGQQALDCLSKARPGAFDVVLMDVMMPVMDGYQATRKIAELQPGLPVIGQTAHVMGAEREACFAAGMVDHIAKPIDPEELVRMILSHLKGRPAD